MNVRLRAIASTVFCLTFAAVGPLAAQDDVADVPSQDLRARKDENKRFFLIGPREGEKPPKAGFGLVVVMPGGPGTAEFHSFVKRIYKHAVPKGYLVAQPVAVKWTDTQGIVWPTKKNRVEGMKFSTEEFVEAVIEDTEKRHKLDLQRVMTLSWSSSGPAAYAISLSSKKVTGSFIAMSVYKPDVLPPLERAKGHRYFLYHSPDDRVCPFWMTKRAERQLKQNGAVVQLKTYRGGHGWRGGLYPVMTEGIKWLEEKRADSEE